MKPFPRPWSITDRNLILDTHRARRHGIEFETNSAFIEVYPWARTYFDVYGKGQIKLGLVTKGNYFLRMASNLEPFNVSVLADTDGGDPIITWLTRTELPEHIIPLLSSRFTSDPVVKVQHYDDIKGKRTTYYTITTWLNGVRHKLIFDEEPGFFARVSLPRLQDHEFLVEKSLWIRGIEHYEDLLEKVKVEPWAHIKPLLAESEHARVQALLSEQGYLKKGLR